MPDVVDGDDDDVDDGVDVDNNMTDHDQSYSFHNELSV